MKVIKKINKPMGNPTTYLKTQMLQTSVSPP